MALDDNKKSYWVKRLFEVDETQLLAEMDELPEEEQEELDNFLLTLFQTEKVEKPTSIDNK